MGDLDLRRRWVLDAPLEVFLVQLQTARKRKNNGEDYDIIRHLEEQSRPVIGRQRLFAGERDALGRPKTRRFSQTYPCQLSFGQLSLGFAPPPSRQARDAALGASETPAAPGTLDRETTIRITGSGCIRTRLLGRFCTRAERVL